MPLPPHSAHATKPSAPATCPWPAHLAHDAVLHPTSHRAIGTRVTGWCGRECSTGIARNEDTTRGPREKQWLERDSQELAPPLHRLVQFRWLRRIQTLRRDDRVGDARPRAHAMPGSVVTVQLGQCGNQVRVSPSRGVVLRARSVGCSCGHPWLTRLFPALFPALPLSGWRRVLRHARERGGRRPPRDARAEIHNAFFREPSRRAASDASDGAGAVPTARSVLIDMEPKVVQSTIRRAKKTGRWQYDPKGTLAFQSGSGNNWARGYNTYGAQVRDVVLDLVRRETEACDHSGGFLLVQSMAGGTAPVSARTSRGRSATNTPPLRF